MILRTQTLPLVDAIKAFTFGHVACDVDLYNGVYNKLREHTKVLNVHLGKTKLFVGTNLTLADIYFALTQIEMQ